MMRVHYALILILLMICAVGVTAAGSASTARNRAVAALEGAYPGG